MNGTWINGRQATDDEAAAVRKGYDDAHERDLRALAGVMGARPESMDGRRIDNLPSVP